MSNKEFREMLEKEFSQIKLNEQILPTDFYINEKPVSISLICPYCGEEIEVPWIYVDEPECWSDDWGEVDCPDCGEYIKLGDYDIG